MMVYYVLVTPPRTYVKAEKYFIEEGGLVSEWGKKWIKVRAVSVEHARKKGNEKCR